MCLIRWRLSAIRAYGRACRSEGRNRVPRQITELALHRSSPCSVRRWERVRGYDDDLHQRFEPGGTHDDEPECLRHDINGVDASDAMAAEYGMRVEWRALQGTAHRARSHGPAMRRVRAHVAWVGGGLPTTVTEHSIRSRAASRHTPGDGCMTDGGVAAAQRRRLSARSTSQGIAR
jgi:hypothetical protein